jgi:hypothetical protein
MLFFSEKRSENRKRKRCVLPFAIFSSDLTTDKSAMFLARALMLKCTIERISYLIPLLSAMQIVNGLLSYMIALCENRGKR